MASVIRQKRFFRSPANLYQVESTTMLNFSEHSQRIEAALDSGDLDQLKDVCLQCDRFLRSVLPLKTQQSVDLPSLQRDLENIIILYKRAVACVEAAKQEAGNQLRSLNRNHTNTNTYLDVARHIAV